MKIKHDGEGFIARARGQETTIVALVERDCHGEYHGNGTITAQDTAMYTSQVLGRLIDTLVRAKLLTAQDVVDLLRGTYKNPEFID